MLSRRTVSRDAWLAIDMQKLANASWLESSSFQVFPDLLGVEAAAAKTNDNVPGGRIPSATTRACDVFLWGHFRDNRGTMARN